MEKTKRMPSAASQSRGRAREEKQQQGPCRRGPQRGFQHPRLLPRGPDPAPGDALAKPARSTGNSCGARPWALHKPEGTWRSYSPRSAASSLPRFADDSRDLPRGALPGSRVVVRRRPRGPQRNLRCSVRPWAAGGAAQRPRRAAGSAETPPVAPRRASGQTLWNPETKATRWLDENDTEFLKYLHTETLWASLS